MGKTLASEAKKLSPEKLIELANYYKQLSKGGDRHDEHRYSVLLDELKERATKGRGIDWNDLGGYKVAKR